MLERGKRGGGGGGGTHTRYKNCDSRRIDTETETNEVHYMDKNRLTEQEKRLESGRKEEKETDRQRGRERVGGREREREREREMIG